MKVEVLIPFHRSKTDTDVVPGDILEVDQEELERIRAVNINMVSVLPEEVEPEKPKRKRKPKE